MAGSTDINGLPWPELEDEPNIEGAVKPLADELDTRIFPRFATVTERDSLISSPIDGMICWVTTHGPMLHSAEWVPFPGVEVARLVQATAQTGIGTGTTTPITFGTGSQVYLPYGGHSTTTNNSRLILPFPGRYEVTGSIVWEGASGGARDGFIALNGTIVTGSSTVRSLGVGVTQGSPAAATLTANGTTDYVTLEGNQTSGGNRATVVTSNAASYLIAVYRGPAH